jgi:hypothetical protein
MAKQPPSSFATPWVAVVVGKSFFAKPVSFLCKTVGIAKSSVLIILKFFAIFLF